ncbi:Tropomyosin [Quillaja saponaria]|uniref:Tropomyosin n=1 Tax=Quillaja saponaria TaxID=32244 RepID=A0AAD7L2Z9_QUISA|nr:Tropomyosin [Quillaja saponaria]
MEEYLHYIKTLRSQMNDVEDHAAKASVEEQTHLTTIHTFEKDRESAKSKIRQVKKDTEEMKAAMGQLCSQILEKQRKIASLESDSSALSQTLELIKQERIGLSAKCIEKSTYYNKVMTDMSAKFLLQQGWVSSNKITGELGEHGLVKEEIDGRSGQTEGMALRFRGKSCFNNNNVIDNLVNDAKNSLMIKLESAKAKLDEILLLKSKLLLENSKMKQIIEEVNCRRNDFKVELKAMDLKTLEEEYNALLLDRDGEAEYLQSLLEQINKLKGISDVVKCACGVQYKVEVGV